MGRKVLLCALALSSIACGGNRKWTPLPNEGVPSAGVKEARLMCMQFANDSCRPWESRCRLKAMEQCMSDRGWM